ncbi:MAG: FAD-binding oxidoreductase [Roseibium sp.]|uniref:NAD(P)/FAD-dependent oxidoreductase n=1 Tax=Roseibium sp. TaxID=1936156 RepID=UPI00262491B7|nr:FAD-binding oxidoreductase [Roseibium sp.]MCV0424185.1 FAD-binding oxidoreductase [Roseibium sp.]
MQSLQRIYDDHAYTPTRRVGTVWESTLPLPRPCPSLVGDHRADVVIIGGGFTGLSAALHLARDHGIEATVLDAAQPGWGASGRNAGFCGYGGAKLSDGRMTKLYGEDQTRCFYSAQGEAIELVRSLLKEQCIDADTQPEGEYCLAHSAAAKTTLPAHAASLKKFTGHTCDLLAAEELRANGVHAEGLHGGLLLPKGFGLNPGKYVQGLAQAAEKAGSRIFGNSPAIEIRELENGRYQVDTPTGRILADRLIVATNGYSSDNLPDWLRGRYLPVVSHMLVTRSLSDQELQSQGWTSRRIAFDTRGLLHYFRLLPDGRMLFGMRGTSDITPKSQAHMGRLVRRHFEAMFPEFTAAETEFHWSGLVCLSRNLVPYVGRIGDWRHAWTGLAYHGGGVAMATYAGRMLAGLTAQKPDPSPYPEFMATGLPRFPIPRLRRHALPFAFAFYGLMDRW